MLARRAIAPRRRNAPRPPEKVAHAFRQWLRGRPCACLGMNPDCAGKIEAAHVDHAGGKGIATKVADRYCLPLSEACHRLQHKIGWKSFEAAFLPGKDAVILTLRYWAAWPGKHAWESKNG